MGGYSYHVLSRGNSRAEVSHKPDDYHAFVELIAEANARAPMRILAYCLMPNHFHLALWPCEDGELRGYPVKFPWISRYLKGGVSLEASGFKSMSMR